MKNHQPSNPNLILPVGTQVVTRVALLVDGLERSCGTLGVVVKALDHSHSYLVQFPDGTQALLRREELTI
ncbi:MAG: hypothetical protein WA828_12850, partial [Coleofasciculaceae cyanobacterium]